MCDMMINYNVYVYYRILYNTFKTSGFMGALASNKTQ